MQNSTMVGCRKSREASTVSRKRRNRGIGLEPVNVAAIMIDRFRRLASVVIVAVVVIVVVVVFGSPISSHGSSSSGRCSNSSKE